MRRKSRRSWAIRGSRYSRDIENLPNLLNKKWGGLRQLPFYYVADVVDVKCVSASGALATSSAQPCAQYQYSSFNPVAEKQLNSDLTTSLYTIRVGIRFTF